MVKDGEDLLDYKRDELEQLRLNFWCSNREGAPLSLGQTAHDF